MKKRIAIAGLVAGLAAAPLALSHLDSTKFHQSYRQSVFAILGANFGPMSSMIKGEMPWDATTFARMASDLANASTLDVARGFAPGTDGGKTRAKPELWKNMDDFNTKWAALGEESEKLAVVAASGDRKAILQQFQKTGGTCKSCHDDYKSKDYLN